MCDICLRLGSYHPPTIFVPSMALFLLSATKPELVGGFKYVLFSSLPGEMIQFDPIWLIFFKGVETTN